MTGGVTLSSGRLSTFVTEVGGGFLAFDALALTRWSADPLRRAEGPVIYVRDMDTGEYWPTSLLTGAPAPESFGAELGESAAAFQRVDGDIVTTLDIRLQDGVELRRLSIRNQGGRERRLDVTSYLELVLNTAAADAAHPAFSKLFVQTEYLPETGAILASRRLRSPDDRPISVVHLLRILEGAPGGDPQVETDRMRFVG